MTQSNYPYQTSFEGQSPYGEQKIHGRSRWKLGCFGFIGAIILLTIIILAGIFFVYPAMTPNKLKGDLMNVVLVPGKDGSNKLWILTDGSFHYVQETKSPGRYSVGRKCLFCKTWTYVYDPVSEKVLNKIKTEYESIITQSWISYGKGKVWIVTGAYDENPPRVFAYDSESAKLLMETQDFINKYPDLQSGIADVRMDKDPDRIVINTKDGRTGFTFVVEEDKLYGSDKEYDETREQDKGKQVAVFVLGSDDSGPRKKLYKVTGPKENVKDRDISESYLKDAKTLMFFTKATAEMLTPNRVYIEGMIFHQDTECCLIVHQSLAGKEADRMLTCVDISSKEKWTASQDQLFDELKVDENDNPFSKIFFMKDNIAVMRSGNLVVLQLKDVGVIGFDYNSGKKLWELEF